MKEVWSAQWYQMQHSGLKKHKEMVHCDQQSWKYCQMFEEGQFKLSVKEVRQIEGG